MGGNGIKADPESLREMAGQLRDSASSLESSANSAPPVPEVTTSSENVGHTLSEITKTVAGLMAGVHQTAGQIDASDGSYGETDNTAAHDIERSGRNLGPD